MLAGMASTPEVDSVALDRCQLRLETYLREVLWDTPVRTVTLDQLAADLPFEQDMCEAAMVAVAATAQNGCSIEREDGHEVAWRVEIADSEPLAAGPSQSVLSTHSGCPMRPQSGHSTRPGGRSSGFSSRSAACRCWRASGSLARV
jgi:hypothetical protein